MRLIPQPILSLILKRITREETLRCFWWLLGSNYSLGYAPNTSKICEPKDLETAMATGAPAL